MKVLQINEKKGEYTIDGESYKSIIDITRDDLKSLIETILFNEETFIDEITEENTIANPVEKIIYEKISLKIKQLIEKKSAIVKSVESNYKELYEKYDLEEFDINK